MGALMRFPDWPERLDEFLRGRAATPFLWGKHDCCAFACDGVFVQCGVDPMKRARGKYKTERGALSWLRRNGGDLSAVADVLGEEAGLQKISPLMAGRGHVVIGNVTTPDGQMPALGIVGLDSRIAHFAAPVGYIDVPTRDCRFAWSFD